MSRLFLFGIVMLFASCSGGSGSGSFQGTDTLYYNKYSKGFLILDAGDSSSVVKIFNPWQGAKDVVFEYFITYGDQTPPEDFQGQVISRPLDRVICMSSSYIAFIDAINCSSSIVGVSGARFISNPLITQGVKRGDVSDIGYDNSVNYELLAKLDADVVFVYGVSGDNSAVINKMRELGLTIVYIGDYLENNPLGKSEWVVLFGELFGSRERAENIFSQIETEYLKVKTVASKAERKPRVMLNSPWMDTWFVPGDSSYMVQLINDAGGKYVACGDDSQRSRPISSEQAFIYLMESDLWLCPTGANTIAELESLNPKVRDLDVVKNGGVYNNNLRRGAMGGSDFWESGTLYPDVILKDMIKIFHPELMKDHNFYYFYRLQ